MTFPIIVVYAVFHTVTRTGICEEFSQHPELMQDMQEMGMNINVASFMCCVSYGCSCVHCSCHPPSCLIIHMHSSIFCLLF
jgi:hypothetical protein